MAIERIDFNGELNLDERFHPFAGSDLDIFEKRGRIQKRFSVRDVVGSLHLNLVRRHHFKDCDLERKLLVSPYNIDPLNKKNVFDYPVHISMCFNETADVSPSFKMTFPDAVRPTFYSFVYDWDTGGKLKDATQYDLEEGDLENPVEIQLPEDRNVLLKMQMEVLSRFWVYPNVAVEL